MKKRIAVLMIIMLIATLAGCGEPDEVVRVPSPNGELELVITRNEDDVATVAQYLGIYILPKGKRVVFGREDIFMTKYADATGEWIDDEHIKVYLELESSKDFIITQTIVYRNITIEYEYID